MSDPYEARARLRRWGFVDAADPTVAGELHELGVKMRAFYEREATRQGYWQTVDEKNTQWTDERHPYHRHLAALVKPGDSVVDFGCGSAHALRNLPAGVRYVGIEGSAKQVEVNRGRFPEQRFVHGDMTADQGLAGTADWAVSFFAIEHCVRPDVLLDRMIATCRPGGRIAILCPNFERGMSSLRSGRSALTKRDKLKRLRVIDAVASHVEDTWLWPRRVRAIHASDLSFPIYLRPRCLDAPYFSDNDAVYLVTERGLVRALERRGCRVEVRARDAPAPPELRGSLTYVVARAPS